MGLMVPMVVSADELEKKVVALSLESGISGQLCTVNLPYSDGWFSTDSMNYNNDLSAVSAALSAGAYGATEGERDSLIKANMKELGVEEKNMETHYDIDYNSNGNDQVAYAFGVKTINVDGEQVPLIIASIRGTSAPNEWLSNFNINDKNLGEPWVEKHEGFSVAQKKVMGDLDKFMEGKDVDKKNAKILVTGHSRGAAVANLMGGDLDYRADSKPNDSIPRDSIYVYTFATPNTIADPNVDISSYRNIFNIVNPEDLVTAVPFTEKTWGYKKYGITKVLPSKSTKYKEYSKMYTIMNKYFKNMTGKSYEPFHQGTGVYDTVNKVVPSLIWGVYGFYSLPTYPYMRFKKIFEGNNSPKTEHDGVYAAVKACPGAQTVLQWFGVTKNRFVNMHTPETYIAWIQANSETPIFGNNTYRVAEVSCDTDMEVKDEDGRVICEIKDGVVNEALLEEFIPAYVLSSDIELDEDTEKSDTGEKGEQKLLFQIPSDLTCTAYFEYKGDKDLDVVVTEKDELSESLASVYFNDVDLAEGDIHTMEFKADEGIGNLVLAGGDHVHDDATVIEADDLNSVKIEVQVEGEGEVDKAGVLEKIAGFFKDAEGTGGVLGSVNVNVGDNVSLKAVPEEGCELEGWFENDELVSEESDFSFQVEGPRKLVVKFKRPSTLSGLFDSEKD